MGKWFSSLERTFDVYLVRAGFIGHLVISMWMDILQHHNQDLGMVLNRTILLLKKSDYSHVRVKVQKP